MERIAKSVSLVLLIADRRYCFMSYQDLNFKTKTKPSVQDQDQDFASQDQDLFVMFYQRPTEKHFSFAAVNENAEENKIPFTAENETKTKRDIHFRPKTKIT